MFTGLIEEIGTIASVQNDNEHFTLTITAQEVSNDVSLGDSIAVNGACLTVTHFDTSSFSVGLAPETLKRTNLGALSENDPVNLERSLLPGKRIGGHFVQGHIDGTGIIDSITRDRDALWITIKTDPALVRYIVRKGYVAIDGASLTVVDTGEDWFNVTLIHYTQSKITLPHKQSGAQVNLETDILAKYVERLVGDPSSRLTENFLATHDSLKEGVR